MRQQTIETNNHLKFGPVDEPSTVEEYDKMANRVGACIDDATSNVWYRGVLPDIWYGLAVRLQKEYGVPFKTKAGPPKKDGTPRIVQDESYPQYVDRIASEQGVAATTFQPFVDEIIRDGYDETAADGTVKHYEIKFDPSARERTAGPAKPAKMDIEFARTYIAQPDNGLQITLGKITQVTGQPCVLTNGDGKQLEGEELVNKVALYVRDYRLAIARTATQGLAATAPATAGGKKKGK